MNNLPAMTPADVPETLVNAAELAMNISTTYDPDSELALREAIREALAVVLPLHTRQLSLQIAHFTGTCPHHPRVSDTVADCMPCQRRATLIGARRLIEGTHGKPAAYEDLAQEVGDGGS